MDCILQSDTRKEPVSGHEMVSTLLWNMQGLLCTEDAAEELTRSRQARGLSAFHNHIIYKFTHTSSDQIYQITYNLIKVIYFCPRRHFKKKTPLNSFCLGFMIRVSIIKFYMNYFGYIYETFSKNTILNVYIQ